MTLKLPMVHDRGYIHAELPKQTTNNCAANKLKSNGVYP